VEAFSISTSSMHATSSLAVKHVLAFGQHVAHLPRDRERAIAPEQHLPRLGRSQMTAVCKAARTAVTANRPDRDPVRARCGLLSMW